MYAYLCFFLNCFFNRNYWAIFLTVYWDIRLLLFTVVNGRTARCCLTDSYDFKRDPGIYFSLMIANAIGVFSRITQVRPVKRVILIGDIGNTTMCWVGLVKYRLHQSLIWIFAQCLHFSTFNTTSYIYSRKFRLVG